MKDIKIDGKLIITIIGISILIGAVLWGNIYLYFAKDEYTELWEKNIDEIFSTFRIN